MSSSSKRIFQSKQIISSHSIGTNQYTRSHQYSGASQQRVNMINPKYQSIANPSAQASLSWQGIGKSLIYKNGSDLQQLFQHKNILLDLINQFDGKDRVIIQGHQRDDFNKRLLLLEGQIDGLLRRKIIFDNPDYQGGTRGLDYMGILNQKENQVVQLEKKIQNLQERLRRKQGREIQLENQILYLNQQLKRKNAIIAEKEGALTHQVAFSRQLASIVENIRKSSVSKSILSDLVIPSLDISDIRLSAKRVAQSRNSSTQAIKLMREFQKSPTFNIDSIIQGYILGLPSDNFLKQKLSEGQKKLKSQKKYLQMQDKFTIAGDIYRQQLDKIRKDNPNVRIQTDQKIFNTLRNSNSSVVRIGDVVQVEKMVEKTVEVPVQDARTKGLIHLLANNYKTLFTKYPKLYDEMDPRLTEFFSQQIIDTMQVDSLDRMVQIVKYVPQVVKVQNVYAYSSQKSRKVQFHLRVLIKALLQQMQKMKKQSGVVPQIDQGVIGMIKQQIMDIVDVDDILKVYRVNAKIVQVEKIVEKIVQRIVQVPKIVQVQRKVQMPYEVKKYQVVQNTVNVPVEVPRLETMVVEKLVHVPQIIEKIVQVPKIIQKIVQVIREVPKIVEVQKIVERFIQVEKIRQVIKQIVVPIIEYRDINIVKQKVVATQQIVQKSIPVDQIIEKIVQVRVEVPKIVQVEKLVQKIVQRIEYVPAPDIRNHIQIRYQPVDRIIQKIIPIIQTVQQTIQVPQIIQKIVQVHSMVQKPIQVQIMVQKIIYRDRIKQVQRIIQKPIIQYKTITKQVQKLIQIPLIHEIIKIQREIIQKPMIEVIQRIIHKQIQIQVPKILYQDRIKQVDRIVNHFIKQPEIVHLVEEKIVPFEKIVQRIKAVPTIVQKIIQKMVEVPKVVQVEKIVQRIVVVPRVIQKIVEVPKIVQKIVERIEFVPQIIQIQKIVHVPVIQQRVVQVEVPRNIYIQMQRPVDVIRQVLVRDQIYKQNTKIQQIFNQRIVVQTRQVPRTLQVQKIVTNIVQQPKIIQLTRDKIIPIQIQVPIDRIIQKMIPIQVIHREVLQVDKIRQKVIPLKQQQIKVVEVEKRMHDVIIEQRIKQVQKIVPYFQDRIVQVDRWREKIVPIQRVIQEIREVKQIVEKVVDRVAEIPKIYQVQKIVEKRVDVNKIIQIERIVPQIVNVNKYIEKIVQKIIQIPLLMQQLKQIQVQKQKIVTVKTQSTNIVQVDRAIEREVIVQKLKQVTNNIHLIQNTLQIVDRIIQKSIDPVLLTQDRGIQVPYIIQKIVQKIVIMPQIVQVLKYVHEIAEKETLGLALGANIGVEERKYKEVGAGLKGQLEALIIELRRTNGSNPNVKIQIQMLEKFLAQYGSFLLFPRIQQIIKKEQVEKIVNTDRHVLIPVESESNMRMQLSKTLLIQKLISQLKSIKQKNPNVKFSNLDDDINLIFLSQLGSNLSKSVGQTFTKQLQDFTASVQHKFKQMGGWSSSHQLMLNSFLQQRFLMANVVKSSNQTIKKTKAISDKRLQQLRKTKQQRDAMGQALVNIKQIIPGMLAMVDKSKSKAIQMQVNMVMNSINQIMVGEFFKGEPMRKLGDLVMDSRVQSMMRQKDNLIIQLKQKLSSQSSTKQSAYFQSRIKQLSMQKSKIESSHSRCAQQKRRYMQDIQSLRTRIRELQTQIQSNRNRTLIMSPKQSINTRYSITSPRNNQKRIQTRIEVQQKSDSQSSAYGVNYHNYRNVQQGSLQNQEHIYKSTYQAVSGRNLMTGSQIGGGGFTSGLGRVSSQQYILGTESRTKTDNQIIKGYGRMEMSPMSSSNANTANINGNSAGLASNAHGITSMASYSSNSNINTHGMTGNGMGSSAQGRSGNAVSTSNNGMTSNLASMSGQMIGGNGANTMLGVNTTTFQSSSKISSSSSSKMVGSSANMSSSKVIGPTTTTSKKYQYYESKYQD